MEHPLHTRLPDPVVASWSFPGDHAPRYQLSALPRLGNALRTIKSQLLCRKGVSSTRREPVRRPLSDQAANYYAAFGWLFSTTSD